MNMHKDVHGAPQTAVCDTDDAFDGVWFPLQCAGGPTRVYLLENRIMLRVQSSQ